MYDARECNQSLPANLLSVTRTRIRRQRSTERPAAMPQAGRPFLLRCQVPRFGHRSACLPLPAPCRRFAVANSPLPDSSPPAQPPQAAPTAVADAGRAGGMVRLKWERPGHEENCWPGPLRGRMDYNLPQSSLSVAGEGWGGARTMSAPILEPETFAFPAVRRRGPAGRRAAGRCANRRHAAADDPRAAPGERRALFRRRARAGFAGPAVAAVRLRSRLRVRQAAALPGRPRNEDRAARGNADARPVRLPHREAARANCVATKTTI